LPAMMLFQNMSISWPSEFTTPIPVITTRLSAMELPIKKKKGSWSLAPGCL
jgi:hypothetical protein